MDRSGVSMKPLRRGSTRSLTLSPSMLKPITSTARKSPGNRAYHQAVVIWFADSAMMTPRSAVGGLTPRPRKLSPASARTAAPRSTEICTSRGEMALGRMCLPSMLLSVTPLAFAITT